MGLYKNTGNIMLIAGLLSIATTIVSIMFMISNLFTMHPSETISLTSYLINVASSVVGLVVLFILAYFSFKLGDELDSGTIKAGAILLVISISVGLAINLYIYSVMKQMLEQFGSGNMPSQELMNTMLRLAGLSLLSLVLIIISYIVYGIGLRNVGDILGLSDLKTAGLLVILGFIPLLFPIGLIIGGLALRRVE